MKQPSAETAALVGAHTPQPIERVAVLRALMLGDMLCAVPALQALRARLPLASITLVGLPWAREWAGRLTCVDGFMAFPGHPGLPERTPDAEAGALFSEAMRAQRLDLAVQLHGSGRLTNAIVADWQARHTLASFEPHGHLPSGWWGRPWPAQGTEAERLTALVAQLDRAGVAAPTRRPDAPGPSAFPVREADRDAMQALLWEHGAQPGRPWVCLHAGAQWPSRRWPPARFAQVGRALARAHDLTLVLTGVESERPVVAALEAALCGLGVGRCVNLVGQTPLWTLGALIEGARLLVSNDTGVSHIAAALGTPSVVISCGAEVSRWTPGAPLRHRVLWADVPCRPCMQPRCPTGHECAMAVGAGDVVDQALNLVEARQAGPDPVSMPC